MPKLRRQVAKVADLEQRLAREKAAAARALRDARRARGLSLRDVAARTPVAAPAVLNIESGRSWRTETAATIADVLDEAPPIVRPMRAAA